MPFIPKTNWKDGDVLPASDMNRIEQGIADAGDVPDVTTTANGLMLATDKVKLNAIAAQATKNDTDANLKNRANHTGTQAISTITGVVPIAQIPTGTSATTVSLGNHTHAAATTSAAGFMSAADKTKLNDLKGVVLATRPTITITDPPDDENLQTSFNAILDYIDDILGR